jgi:hypothetical protein
MMMSIIQNPLWLLTLIALVVGVQVLVVYLRHQTKKIVLSLLPNVGLLVIGLIISVIGYVVALSEPGSWPGLGLIILLMMTFIVTIISTFISLFLNLLIKPTPRTNSVKGNRS